MSSKKCLDEAQLLAYSEGSLSYLGRTSIEKHLGNCDRCREVLALAALIDTDSVTETTLMSQEISEIEIREQTARIITIAKEEEYNRGAAVPVSTGGWFRNLVQVVKVPATAFGAVALLLIAIVAAVLYVLPEKIPVAQQGMDALKQATKYDRRISVRISGNLPWSPYSVTRGEKAADDLQFQRALDKLTMGEDTHSSIDSKETLARIYLSRMREGDLEKAVTLLDEQKNSGNETPQLLNDIGAALFEKGKYIEAIEMFSKALERSPSMDEALFNKAMAEEKAGKIAEARESWGHFISSTPDPKWKEEALWRLESLEAPTSK